MYFINQKNGDKYMRSYIVKLAATSGKLRNDEKNQQQFATDSVKYMVPGVFGHGLIGGAALRHFTEDEEDIKGSQLRGAGYGVGGALGLGMLAGLGARGAGLGDKGVHTVSRIASTAGLGLGNAYLNKKIREERSSKGRK